MNINDSKDQSIDLDHFNYITGKIGRIKVLDHMHVIAGDKINYNLTGTVELSKLRRSIVLDPKVDICTFFVPHRHAYGDLWIDFIKNAGKEFIQFPRDEVNAANPTLDFLRLKPTGGDIPKEYFHAYTAIWNNYFRNPQGPDLEFLLNGLPDEVLRDGMQAMHLPSIWTAPLPDNSDVRSGVTVDGSNQIDLYALQETYAKLSNDQERLYFNMRYRDLMEAAGGWANPDAEQRPFFLGRSSFYSSGYNAVGTDQVGLGQMTGLVQFPFNHSIPRYKAPEHGILMTVAVIRFDPIHEEELDYFQGPSISYDTHAGDPVVDSNQEPASYNLATFLTNGSTGDQMDVAHGQWWKTCPNYVDSRFSEVKGFPFLTKPITLSNQLYVLDTDYDHIFNNSALGHWQMIMKANVSVYRDTPTTYGSIMTTEG